MASPTSHQTIVFRVKMQRKRAIDDATVDVSSEVDLAHVVFQHSFVAGVGRVYIGR